MCVACLCPRRVAELMLGVVVGCLLAGCGGPSAKNLVVDQTLARQSLTTALDAWKAGGSGDGLIWLSAVQVGGWRNEYPLSDW